MKKYFHVTLEFLWLAVIFILPLMFLPNIFTTFELAKVTVFKIAVVLMLMLWVARGVPLLQVRGARFLWWALAVFLGFYLLACVFSVAPILSIFGWYPRFQGLLTLLCYVIFGAVIFFEVRTEGRRTRVLWTMTIGFLVVCVFALMQKFLPGFLSLWNDAEFNGRIYGTMANPNYLATYVVMLLPLLVLRGFSGGKWQRIIAGISIFVGLLTLIFTLSRAGFLAVIVSLIFLGAVVAYRRRAKKMLVGLAILPLLAGGFLWLMIANQQASWVQESPFLKRLTISEENMSSARSRLEIWQGTVRQIMASPLVGFGPETFAVSFPPFAPETVNTREDVGEIADHAHNEPLDLAAQIGVPGALAFVIFILGLVVVGARKFLQDGDVVLAGLSSGILGLFVANLFGFSVTVHWVFLVVFAALILNTLPEKKLRAVKVGWPIFGVIVVLSMGMLWLCGTQLLADIHMRKGFDAASSGDLALAANEYKTAMEIAPLQSFYALNFAYIQLQRLDDGQNLSAVEKVEAVNAAEQVARLRGGDRFSVFIVEELQNH